MSVPRESNSGPSSLPRTRMLKAAISGSFRRHMTAIYNAVESLTCIGVTVLSPCDARVVERVGDFLFVASDRLRSIKLVEDRHLAAIRAADFLWVVCPDGYTGQATCMEIGYARSVGVPIFAQSPLLDVTICEYVDVVATISEAVSKAKLHPERERVDDHVLLDPEGAVGRSIKELESLVPVMTGRIGNRRTDAERALQEVRSDLAKTFSLARPRRRLQDFA